MRAKNAARQGRLQACGFPFLLNPFDIGRFLQNADIIQTKCIQKRECEFFNHSASVTYNFSVLKCLHLQSPLSLEARGRGQNCCVSSRRIRTISKPKEYKFQQLSHLQSCRVPLSGAFTIQK
jgi:hypothetical protein